MFMDNIVIVSGARTAIGAFKGAFKQYEAGDLGGFAIKEALKRANIDGTQIDEVIMGNVGQTGKNAFIARIASVKGGVHYSAGALSVNRLCSSGLQAIVTAGMEIMMGQAEIVVAGGTESMTNIPYYIQKSQVGYTYGNRVLEDGLLIALSDPFGEYPMGITAENVAEKYKVSRKEQDEFALSSQIKAAKAIEKDLFKDEIVPVKVNKNKKETYDHIKDEHPRPNTTMEELASLKPAFKTGGTVTAGNASGINDAAAALIVMKESKAREMGLKPLARITGSAFAGVDPAYMGIGPVPAVKKLLKSTNIKLDEIGLIELNEAFAAQSIACIRELNLDEEKVNVNGGAIALGHPIGATGAILALKLIYDMRRKGVRYGLETLCIGGGQGLAVIFELCEN